MRIFSPSRGRAGACLTHEHLPDTVYVVAQREVQEYLDAGVAVKQMPNEVDGNLARVRNWILDHTDEWPFVMVDDDVRRFGRWTKTAGNVALEPLDSDRLADTLEVGMELARGWGSPVWGMNAARDRGSYREYTPFTLRCYVSGSFMAFTEDPGVRFDETLPLKEDYDFCLQVANKWRKILRINYLTMDKDDHGNEGGCAFVRNIQVEQEQFDRFQQKWGDRIVRRDTGRSQVRRKKDVGYDLNPVIRIPLGGI